MKSDVWSLGISLIELALGRFPFADDDLVDSDDDSDLRALRGGEDAEGTIQPGGGRRLDPAAAVADQETKRERRKSQGVSLGGGGTTMSILDLLQHIVNEPAPTLTPVTAFPAEAHAFVKDCLSKDPKDRKTPQELLVSDLARLTREKLMQELMVLSVVLRADLSMDDSSQSQQRRP